PNAIAVPYLNFAEVFPHVDVLVALGGYGTVTQALSCGVPMVLAGSSQDKPEIAARVAWTGGGVPVLISPAAGDMAETAARVDWAGVGVRLAPRCCTPWGVRLAVRRALRSRALRQRAGELAAWARAHPGPEAAATQLERWAATASR